MAIIANDEKVFMVSKSTNTTYSGSAALKAMQEWYTMQDVKDTVGVAAQGPQGVPGVQGAQGIPGTAGAVGPAGLTWRSTWVSGTSYIANDAVSYNGASWFCILATSGTTNPSADATHWALLASQGAQGVQGIQGIQGLQGIQGIQGPPAAQNLQQTVDLGDSITDGSYYTTVTAPQIAVEEIGTQKATVLKSEGITFIKSGGLTQLTSSTLTGVRNIALPNASGTIALQNYKSYVALISQSGTSDPTATVVFNDTAATFTWSYDDVGSYFVTCSSPILLSGKTVVFITTQGNPGNSQNKIFGGTRSNNSTVSLFTSTNGILDLNFEIRIYN